MSQPVERYRLLLVDDEPLILKSIRAAIAWDRLGIEIVGEARNGQEGMRQVERLSPDIVLSDIRMPSMDGITFMGQAMKIRPDMIFIIISGYGEFEYAREALREGAFDYMLKPIDHDELEEIAKAAVEKLREDRRRKEEAETLRHSLQSLSILARERMYAELIEGNDKPYRQLAFLEQTELERSYYMQLIRLHREGTNQERWGSDDKRLWSFVIRNILEELGGENGALAIFPFHGGEWVILLPKSPEAKKQALGEEIVRSIQRYAHSACSVGISRDFRGLDQLGASYASAKRALYWQFLRGRGGVYADALQPVEEAKIEYPMEKERQLSETIQTLNAEKLTALMAQWRKEMEQKAYSRELIERVMLEFAVALNRQFQHWHTQAAFPLEALLDILRSSESLADMMSIFERTLVDWMKDIRETPAREDGKSVVEKAKAYIENFYHKDLGIDEIADSVHLSVSHFCSIFKQESGFTFLEYLTKVRIDKACFMLRNTDVKIYQVAPLVGYQDAKYFTQVFKKLTGLTPSEYREALSNRQDDQVDMD